MNVWQGISRGAAAGAAGTTALNAVTYLDMAVRARSTSSAPEDVVEKIVDRSGVGIPGEGDARKNRLAGLGPLSGIATGVAVGACAGAARALGLRSNSLVTGTAAGLGAMAGTDLPMAALGISDPRRWSATDWLSDAVPHLAYGLVTAVVLELLESR
jgi:hypothetical protein